MRDKYWQTNFRVHVKDEWFYHPQCSVVPREVKGRREGGRMRDV